VLFSRDLSCIPLQCVRTIASERGWGGRFYTFTVFLFTLTSTWRYCLLECEKGLLSIVKPKPKLSLQPITKDIDSPANQSKLEVITCSWREAREKWCEGVTIGLAFTSDWMKKWRECFKPNVWRSKCKTNNFSTLKCKPLYYYELTNRMWFSVVCTLIGNDKRHHSSQNVVDALNLVWIYIEIIWVYWTRNVASYHISAQVCLCACTRMCMALARVSRVCKTWRALVKMKCKTLPTEELSHFRRHV